MAIVYSDLSEERVVNYIATMERKISIVAIFLSHEKESRKDIIDKSYQSVVK